MSENNLQNLLEFKQNSQSLESRIEEIRHDHKNSLTTIGEALDNSIGWGKCKNIKINLYENTFCIADDGVGFESYERLKVALLLGKKNNQVFDSNSDILKGKFGLGLPKGSIIVGNKVIIITKVESKYFTAIANWDLMKSQNCFTPIIRDSTPEETQEYNSYFGNGSLIKYENLLNESILNAENIYDYITCLYQPVKNEHLPKIYIMKNNNLYNFKMENIKNPIINYLDITFSNEESLYLKTGTLLKHIDGHYSVNFTNNNIDKSDILFEIKIIYNALNLKFYEKNKAYGFINKKTENLIGFKIYRNGRDVTTDKAMRFSSIDPDKKMYRDKGLRIKLVFEGNMKNTNIFDHDFKVSSLKCIDESCYYHFSKTLKKCLEDIGKNAEENFENRKKDDKEASEKNLSEMFENIIKNYQELDLEYVKKSLIIVNRLKEKREYNPTTSIENNNSDEKEIIPFKFDKRNGFYKNFCENEYKKIKYRLLIRMKIIEEPNTINSIIDSDLSTNNNLSNIENTLENVNSENSLENEIIVTTENSNNNPIKENKSILQLDSSEPLGKNLLLGDNKITISNHVPEVNTSSNIHEPTKIINNENNDSIINIPEVNTLSNTPELTKIMNNDSIYNNIEINNLDEISLNDKISFMFNLKIEVIHKKIKKQDHELINKLYNILK
jgi:hypothetical protein